MRTVVINRYGVLCDSCAKPNKGHAKARILVVTIPDFTWFRSDSSMGNKAGNLLEKAWEYAETNGIREIYLLLGEMVFGNGLSLPEFLSFLPERAGIKVYVGLSGMDYRALTTGMLMEVRDAFPGIELMAGMSASINSYLCLTSEGVYQDYQQDTLAETVEEEQEIIEDMVDRHLGNEYETELWEGAYLLARGMGDAFRVNGRLIYLPEHDCIEVCRF